MKVSFKALAISRLQNNMEVSLKVSFKALAISRLQNNIYTLKLIAYLQVDNIPHTSRIHLSAFVGCNTENKLTII